MKVGITGGCGFVGGTIADLLRGHGHQVTQFDVQHSYWERPETVRSLDICQPQEVEGAFDGLDAVLHLAAVSNTGAAFHGPVQAARVNVLGTGLVLEECRRAGVSRVIVAGSTLVSGAQVPMEAKWPAESWVDGELDHRLDRWVVDEESPFLPVAPHPYVWSKIATEQLAMSYLESFGLPVTVLRYGIQYGPRMTPGVLFSNVITKALNGQPITIDGDGQQWRQYMHVDDLAHAHLQVLDASASGRVVDGVFIVAPLEKVTVADAVDAVSAAVAKRGKRVEVTYGPARLGEIPVRLSSPMKAKQAFGWEPSWTLLDGVEDTVAWYCKELGAE